MSIVNTRVKVPNLRFIEFTGSWEELKLGDLTSKMQSGLSRKLSSVDIGMPVIRSNNIQDQNIDISDLSYWYVNDPQGANTSNYILHKEDLLVNFINSLTQIGKFAIYSNDTGRDTIYTTNLMRLRFNNRALSRYVYYYFSLKKYDDYIDSITKPAVNQASFTTVDFKNFIISVPSTEEQDKITAFLYVIDSKIAILKQKIDLLKKYKKGVMQAIFTQAIRFKDKNGKDYHAWQEKKLGDFSDVSKLAGYEFTKHIVYSDTGTLIGLRGLNIKNNRLNLDEIMYIDKSDLSKLSRSKLYTSDLMFTYVGTIGEVALIPENDKFYLAPNVARIRVDNNIALPEFINQYFLRPEFKKIVDKYVATSSQPALSMTNIRKFSLNVPALDEQQKIVDFLTSIDGKINLEESKLEQAKNFKKALLQQMFV